MSLCCVLCPQLAANLLLFLCSNLLGAIDYYIADRKQRRSVLETRQSLEVKLSLEAQNLQQVSGARGRRGGGERELAEGGRVGSGGVFETRPSLEFKLRQVSGALQ